MRERILIIPGLDGDPTLIQAAAPRLFRGMRVLPFDHSRDAMAGDVDGLAERALAVLDTDRDTDAPAFVCGESFGGTAALTLARYHPARVRGLLLLSAFDWYALRVLMRATSSPCQLVVMDLPRAPTLDLAACRFLGRPCPKLRLITPLSGWLIMYDVGAAGSPFGNPGPSVRMVPTCKKGGPHVHRTLANAPLHQRTEPRH